MSIKKLALWAAVVALGTSVHAQIAFDSGSDAAYSGGWTNGSNGGFGFQPWSLTTDTSGGGFAGHFIGDPSGAGISGMGTETFAMFANPDGQPDFNSSQADRDFTSALNVGEIFRFDWGVNFDSNSTGNKGFSLFAGANELVNINMGGSATITISGAFGSETLFGNYGTQVMTLSFQYLGDTSLRVFGTGRDGSETYDETLVVLSGAPDAFRLYMNNHDSGDERQPYADNFEIIPEPGTFALLGIALLGLIGLRRRM